MSEAEEKMRQDHGIQLSPLAVSIDQSTNYPLIHSFPQSSTLRKYASLEVPVSDCQSELEPILKARPSVS